MSIHRNKIQILWVLKCMTRRLAPSGHQDPTPSADAQRRSLDHPFIIDHDFSLLDWDLEDSEDSEG
jgi:hypothetical protein